MIETERAELAILLTPRSVAARLDCGERRAREMMKDGILPTVIFGKRRRVSLAALERWIEQQAGQTA